MSEQEDYTYNQQMDIADTLGERHYSTTPSNGSAIPRASPQKVDSVALWPPATRHSNAFVTVTNSLSSMSEGPLSLREATLIRLLIENWDLGLMPVTLLVTSQLKFLAEHCTSP